MSIYIKKKVAFLLAMTILSGAAFSKQTAKIDEIVDKIIEEKKRNYLGLSVEAGISMPFFYQPLSVNPEFFNGIITCPSAGIGTQAKYEISSTNIVLSSMFTYNWLGTTSSSFWGNCDFNGMKGTSWSFMGGLGYSFKSKSGGFHFVPSAVAGMHNVKLNGSMQLTSLDTVLLKNDYEYSATDFEAGVDLYFMKKFNDLWGISLSIMPLFTLGSTGSLNVTDYIKFKEWDADCSPETGSFILDSKINFVLYL